MPYISIFEIKDIFTYVCSLNSQRRARQAAESINASRFVRVSMMHI